MTRDAPVLFFTTFLPPEKQFLVKKGTYTWHSIIALVVGFYQFLRSDRKAWTAAFPIPDRLSLVGLRGKDTELRGQPPGCSEATLPRGFTVG